MSPKRTKENFEEDALGAEEEIEEKDDLEEIELEDEEELDEFK